MARGDICYNHGLIIILGIAFLLVSSGGVVVGVIVVVRRHH